MIRNLDITFALRERRYLELCPTFIADLPPPDARSKEPLGERWRAYVERCGLEASVR